MQEGSRADAAAAAAGEAATDVTAGGAKEEWERQRSLIPRLRGTWPAESRIAAAAAAQKAEEEAMRTTAQAGIGGGESGGRGDDGGDRGGAAKMGDFSAPSAASAVATVGGQPARSSSGATWAEHDVSAPRSAIDGQGADGGFASARDNNEQNRQAALPGLSDLVPSGPRYGVCTSKFS